MNARHAIALLLFAVAALCLLLGTVGSGISLFFPDGWAIVLFVWLPCVAIGAPLFLLALHLYRTSEHRLPDGISLAGQPGKVFPITSPIALILFFGLTCGLAIQLMNLPTAGEALLGLAVCLVAWLGIAVLLAVEVVAERCRREEP
jgi:hypothetical protein